MTQVKRNADSVHMLAVPDHWAETLDAAARKLAALRNDPEAQKLADQLMALSRMPEVQVPPARPQKEQADASAVQGWNDCRTAFIKRNAFLVRLVQSLSVHATLQSPAQPRSFTSFLDADGSLSKEVQDWLRRTEVIALTAHADYGWRALRSMSVAERGKPFPLKQALAFLKSIRQPAWGSVFTRVYGVQIALVPPGHRPGKWYWRQPVTGLETEDSFENALDAILAAEREITALMT